MIRAAVVGAGLMGHWHARELRRAAGSLVGVCDLDGAAATRLAERHAGGATFTDFDRLLDEASPDVVHVCTPLASHAELALKALERGVHVLAEKPLAATAAQCEELVALAERTGSIVCPVHQYLFQRSMLRAGALLEAISPLLHVATCACSAGGIGRCAEDLDTIAAEILPHPLAVLNRILGEPVDGLDWRVAAPRPGELRADAVAGETTASVLVSMSTRPTANELLAFGERGTVRIDFFHDFAVSEGGAVSRYRKIVRPLTLGTSLSGRAAVNLARRAAAREPAFPGLRALIAELYEAIAADRPAPIAHAETRAVARARDAIIELTSTPLALLS